MKIKFSILLFMTIVLVSAGKIFAQDEQEQRIRASYILAFNKAATGGEVNYWKGQGNLSMTDLLRRHKDYIRSNKDLWDGILRTSYTDILGKAISDAEYAYHVKNPRTWFEIVNDHMTWLNGNPSEYQRVIKDSYQRVFNRQPNSGELNYWMSQPKVSFNWLVNAHYEWQKTQRQGNATSGVISTSSVASLQVSPSVLADTRQALGGLIGSSMVAAGAGNMVAAGAGNMVAAGAGNIIAASR